MRITRLIVLVAMVIVIILLIGRFNFSEADFSLYNPAWNGMTEFSGNSSVHLLYSISDLSGAGEKNTLLIVSPLSNFSEDESGHALSFMQRGGTIIVMDDFGMANTLLENISSPITLYQAPLCDDNYYYKRQSFPVINSISQMGLTSNVSELVLNHPATLNITGNATVMALTSPLGWVDSNANLMIDRDEVYGRYPVMARTSFGEGTLYVVSDPDIIVNIMIYKGNNSVFASNIMNSGTVYMDVSHGQKIPPLATVFYIIKYDLVAQLLCSLLIALIGYAMYKRTSIKRSILGPEKKPELISKKRTIIDFMRAKLPVKESNVKELDKKL